MSHTAVVVVVVIVIVVVAMDKTPYPQSPVPQPTRAVTSPLLRQICPTLGETNVEGGGSGVNGTVASREVQ